MANANWTGNNAKAKGRHAAYGVLMHDDKGERDRHEHANKDIDTTLTHMNFGCGPHAEGEAYEPETYGQKRARLDAILDEHDYKEGSGKNKRVALQGIQIYPPDALLGYDDETGLWSKTDDLDRWFVRADEVARETLGEAGWVSADVHYDEMHWYKEPKTLIDKCSKPHLSEHFVPVVGDPEAGTAKISGKDFSARKRILALNKAIEDMTQNEFGCKWQTKEPRNPQRESKTVEQAKGESAVAEAEADAGATLDRAQALLDEAVAKHSTALVERDGCVVLDRDGERETRRLNTPEDGDLAAFGDRIDRRLRVGGPGPEGSTVVEVRHAPRVVAARTKRDVKRDAKRVREAAEADARRVREEADRDAQAVYDDTLAEAHLALVEEREGDELEAAHDRHVLARKRADVAEREQMLDERVALVNEHEEAVLRREDDVRRREDAVAEREAEATRLLDGYERPATIADFMPQLPPDADEGERAAADERARKAFAGACYRNGLKPPTVHVPGLREREAELTRQEQELVPLLKAVRAFIEDPVTFVADALRRVQGYIAEVAHSEGTTRSQRLTNEMMNDAIDDATRLMYAHPGDPRMREACAPDAPALREDERSGPVFDVDAWAEERRRKRAAKSATKMTRQTLQQRLTQQPEQQPVREVWLEPDDPKPSRSYDGPEM